MELGIYRYKFSYVNREIADLQLAVTFHKTGLHRTLVYLGGLIYSNTFSKNIYIP